MNVLGIDPSSTRCGWAVGEYANGRPLRILAAGDVTPTRTADPSIERITTMMFGLIELVEQETAARGSGLPGRLDAIVIEIPSGKTHGRIPRKMSGLPIYGMAVGAIWAAVKLKADGARVVTVEDNIWTRGVPKKHRQRRIAVQFPQYAQVLEARADGGADIADAIGLVQWFADHQHWSSN